MKFPEVMIKIADLVAEISGYTPDPSYVHDRFVKIAVEEAVQAVKEGNVGVGACLVKHGEVVIRDHNRLFHPYFRSDLDAEMVVLNQLEEEIKHTASPDIRSYMLFSSQEPCPMCMIRLIRSGVGKVFYGYRDAASPDQGELSSLERLPSVWLELAERREFSEADCSPDLKEMARQAFLLSAPNAIRKFERR